MTLSNIFYNSNNVLQIKSCLNKKKFKNFYMHFDSLPVGKIFLFLKICRMWIGLCGGVTFDKDKVVDIRKKNIYAIIISNPAPTILKWT